MKNLLYLFFCLAITQSTTTNRKLTTKLENVSQQAKPERETFFTPYYNLHDDDEARSIGADVPVNKPANGTASPYGTIP